jgi:hypothetical protein
MFKLLTVMQHYNAVPATYHTHKSSVSVIVSDPYSFDPDLDPAF